MKVVLSIFGAVAVVALMIVLFGDRLIRSRFAVGRSTFAVPAGEDPLSGSLVYGGLQTALQKCGMNASAWAVAPWSDWQMSDHVGRTNTNSVLIILTNRIDGATLFTRVSFVSSNVLEYDVYRSK